MPARETRNYVKNVISNLGIYRIRFNQSSPALTSLAAGTGGIFIPGAATETDIQEHVKPRIN